MVSSDCFYKFSEVGRSQNQVYIPVKAFLPPVAAPAGITFNTLNLTVFEIGLHKINTKTSVQCNSEYSNDSNRSHNSGRGGRADGYKRMRVDRPALANDHMVTLLHTETR